MDSGQVVLDHVVLPKFEPPCAVFEQDQQRTPSSPSEFFALAFPSCISKYGTAMLERRRAFEDDTVKITPVSINEDALAAILGTKECGDVVYHRFEQQFYSRDHRTGFFNPVDVEDLKLVLSQLFLKCIEQMPGCVDVQPLFNEFRSDEVLERVIKRAKAVLAVDDEFFSAEGPNARNPVNTPKESVRLFVDQCLTEDDDSTLTFADCFEAYSEFCRSQKLPAVHRNQFKEAMRPNVMRRFNRGIRHDLHRFEADRALGWRGIKLAQR